MSQSDTSSGHGARTIGLAIIMALIAGTLIAGMLSYTLKRHNNVHANAARQASESKAIAISQILADLGGDVLGSGLFRLQGMLQRGFAGTTLVRAMVIDTDDMVVASKATALIGQQMKEDNWIFKRDQNKELVSKSAGQDGKELLTVIEPMKEKGVTVAWVYLEFALPPLEQFMVPPADRWTEVARLVVPIATLLLFTTWWLLRSANRSLRKGGAQPRVDNSGNRSVGEAAFPLKKVS
jgi:hypothetical protein